LTGDRHAAASFMVMKRRPFTDPNLRHRDIPGLEFMPFVRLVEYDLYRDALHTLT